MPIVKLDAISSTNDFLKEMAVNQHVENFTVVVAENQTGGRGQMGTKWMSEPGKNLTMSVLIENPVADIVDIFNLNICVCMAVFQSLDKLKIPQLSIKWPNDIMSGNKKIGGILIENTVRSNKDINSIAGIGINVNQTNFDLLPNATSLFNLLNQQTDREMLLSLIVDKLKANVGLLEQNATSELWNDYTSYLFKKGIPTAFERPDGCQFMGIITGVDSTGKLKLMKENEQIEVFDIKEIKMLY